MIRFARFSETSDPKKFYGTLLQLYLPHRSDTQLKTRTYITYESFHNHAWIKPIGSRELKRVSDIVEENRAYYEKHRDVIDVSA